jgi:hypothetical protein
LIDWLLANHRAIVAGSRYIVGGCALALIGIASLPHNSIDRVVAVIGILAIALIFLGWLAVIIVTIAHPRLFHRLRDRRRKDGQGL